jgi:hypothetical protein
VKKIGEWWGRHFLLLEFLVAVLATAAFAWRTRPCDGCDGLEFLKGGRGNLYGTLASVAGSLFGFVMAAMSIVIPAVAHPRMRLVRESGQIETLWRVFRQAITWLGLTTALALVAMVVDRDDSPSRLLVIACMLGATVSFARSWRVAWALVHVVRVTSKEPPKAGPHARDKWKPESQIE